MGFPLLVVPATRAAFLGILMIVALPPAHAQDGWSWSGAFDLPDQEHVDGHGPRVAADGPQVAVATAPWQDGDTLHVAALTYLLEGRRLVQQEYVRLEAPATQGPLMHAVDTSEGVLALGLAGRGSGSGRVLVQQADQEHVLLAPSDAAGFGRALAVSPGLLVIGALDQVHVFVATPDGWKAEQILVNDLGDDFGASLALAGGLLAVGAPSAAHGAGAVFLYEWTGSAFVSVAHVTAKDASHLGKDVAVQGSHAAALGQSEGKAKAFLITRASGGWAAEAMGTAETAAGALALRPDSVVLSQTAMLCTFSTSGPDVLHDPVDEVVVGPGFGSDVAVAGSAVVVAESPDRIHLFHDTPPPACEACEAPPEPVAPAPDPWITLGPQAPLRLEPGDGVRLEYSVAAPARLQQTLRVLPAPPPGMVAVPGTQEAPDLTQYLDVHVEAFEAQSDAAPEPRIRITFEYDPSALPPGTAEGRIGLFYHTGRAWVELSRQSPGASVAGEGPVAPLQVFAGGRDPEADTVWAIVNHTSTYAIGLVPAAASAGDGERPLGPWAHVAILAFLAGGVWATNLILGLGGQRKVLAFWTLGATTRRQYPASGLRRK